MRFGQATVTEAGLVDHSNWDAQEVVGMWAGGYPSMHRGLKGLAALPADEFSRAFPHLPREARANLNLTRSTLTPSLDVDLSDLAPNKRGVPQSLLVQFLGEPRNIGEMMDQLRRQLQPSSKLRALDHLDRNSDQG
jgi:hypothetical protein